MELPNSQPGGKVPESGLKAAAFFVWDLLKVFLIALVIIVPFRMFIAEPFVVSGSSMLPNFYNGDYLIIDRLSYRLPDVEPSRGDVVVLKFPKDTSQFFIKRVIGLPGETIRLEQGRVVIFGPGNQEGTVLDEPYLASQNSTSGTPHSVTLGSGEYFVLGDNRPASSDSRVWGILPREDIVGRVWLRVFPLSRSESFKTPAY